MHSELGEVKFPLKAVVSLENNIVTLDSGRIFSFRNQKQNSATSQVIFRPS